MLLELCLRNCSVNSSGAQGTESRSLLEKMSERVLDVADADQDLLHSIDHIEVLKLEGPQRAKFTDGLIFSRCAVFVNIASMTSRFHHDAQQTNVQLGTKLVRKWKAAA